MQYAHYIHWMWPRQNANQFEAWWWCKFHNAPTKMWCWNDCLGLFVYFAPNLRRTCLVPYSHHQDHWWIAVYTPDCRVIVMCARANSFIALTWSHAANEWMIDWLHYFPTLFFIRAQKTRLTLFLPPFWICRSWKIVPPIAIHRQKIPTRPRPHNRSRIWGPNGKYRQQTNQTANLGYGRPRILPLHH